MPRTRRDYENSGERLQTPEKLDRNLTTSAAGPSKPNRKAKPKNPPKRKRSTKVDVIENPKTKQARTSRDHQEEVNETESDDEGYQPQPESSGSSGRLIAYSYEKPTQVQFIEGDETVTMTVDNDGTSYCETASEDEQVDYEDDNEVSFRNDNLKTTHEEESDYETVELMQQLREHAPQVEYHQPQPQSSVRNERIHELDVEMKTKLVQMRHLLVQGGLTESVQEIDQTIDSLTDNRRKKGRNKCKFQNGNENGNSNKSNSIMKKQMRRQVQNPITLADKLLESLSEETIYKNAVPKKSHASSSSEDNDLVNTSDETTNDQMGDLNLIEGGFVTEPWHRECTYDDEHTMQQRRRSAPDPIPSTSRMPPRRKTPPRMPTPEGQNSL